MRASHLLSLAVLALACCSGQPPEPWERPDHTPPTVTDTAFCHNEGRRQASTLYPDRAANDVRGLPRTSDDRRFPAEVRFYEQCMTRLGYVRASAAPVG